MSTENQKNVHRIKLDEKKIILIGTVHVSTESANVVQEIIEAEKPDTVCVELCQTRFDSIRKQNHWQNMDIVKVIREGKVPLLMANLVLASFQKKMGDKLGVQPGLEMIRAMDMAKEVNAEVVLADRDVSVTLKRAWKGLSFWEKMKIFAQLSGGILVTPDIDEEEIEKLKEKDMLSEILETFAKELPKLKETLIDERDSYLATKISQAEGNIIVAVVGAGHVPGILKKLDKPEDLSKLETIPPSSSWGKVIKWIIPLAILGMIGYGFSFADMSVSVEMIKRWILANGILAAIGALLAGGHIVTVIAAFIAAPITSLNPTIAAGWVSGLTEAWIRKPTVSDFERLPQDITSFRGFWKNEITRILLVVVFSNLGSSIGTFVGIPLLTSLL